MNSDSNATPSLLAGRYQFIRTIARGGMSVIYLAQDIRLDRPVAVKVLFAGLAHNPAFVERFRREARSAARLNHPHIVKVYDSGQDGNIYFIIMEYLEGMSLSEVLRREGSLNVETSVKITEDVAEALAEAHKQGVIHRDIKPGNIIFVPSAGLKVADFGIARAISGSISDLTQAGTVMGTATYFSPEQAKGEAVDYRTDLYSLGVVMFEMMAGKPPFQGDSPISVAYQHVQAGPPALSDVTNGAVPVVLSNVVAKLLSKNPDYRYQDAAQLQIELRALRKGGLLALAGHGQGSSLSQDQAGLLLREQGRGPVQAPAPQAGSAPPAQGPPPQSLPAQGPPPKNPRTPPVGPPPGKAPKSTTQIQLVRQRRRTTFFWGFFVLILAVIALIVTVVFTSNRDSGTETEVSTVIDVPSVVRDSEEQAQQRLDELGFDVKIEREENADIPAGQVIRQAPRAGSRQEPGTEITLTVSLGAQAITVPDVVEYQLTDAQRVLREACSEREPEPCFEVAFVEVESQRPLGEVVAQDPSAGEQLQPGSRVVLSVSKGLLTAVVPDLTGLSISEAARMLSDLGLVVEQRRFSHDTTAVGDVISTDPPAGETLDRGATVVVNVSDGPSILTVPDVTGLDEATAVSELRGWGFEVTVLYREVLPGEIAGTVVEQDPLPGTNLNPDDPRQVTIIVGTPSSELEPPTSLRPPPELE